MTHYTAIVIIERVEEEKAPEFNQYDKLVKAAVPRSTHEIGKVVVRSEEIDQLIEKVKQHVELINED